MIEKLCFFQSSLKFSFRFHKNIRGAPFDLGGGAWKLGRVFFFRHGEGFFFFFFFFFTPQMDEGFFFFCLIGS